MKSDWYNLSLLLLVYRTLNPKRKLFDSSDDLSSEECEEVTIDK